MTEKPPRVTLTAKQLLESAGAELLSICKATAEDGVLTDEEIAELQSWLERNASTDLPALAFLRSLVNRILADKIVTDDERKELLLGIERVLPKNVRDQVSRNRRTLEGFQKAKNRRIEIFDFMVAGAHLKKYAEVIEDIGEEDKIFFECEPDNKKDRHAVKVLAGSNFHIGYVPRDQEEYFCELLNEGNKYRAFVKKIIGYNHRIPVIVAEFYGKEATVGGVKSADEPIPAGGCASVVLFLFITSTYLAWAMI